MNEYEFITRLPTDEYKSSMDRYKDFRQLFNTEQGQRVLKEILSWGHITRPNIYKVPIDPYMTHLREGERNVVLRLLVTINREPPHQPTKAKGKVNE